MDCPHSKNKNYKEKNKEPRKPSLSKQKNMGKALLLSTNQLEKVNCTFKVAQIICKARFHKIQQNKLNSCANNIMSY